MTAPTEDQVAQQKLAHQKLLEERDIFHIQKTFRNPRWKPNQRRNKNIKTILGDAQKREASAIATPQGESGDLTPAANEESGSTSATESSTSANAGPNLAQASSSLSKLVLEKNLKNAPGAVPSGSSVAMASAPAATYTNIESAPSMTCNKRFCDITGLPAPYVDPKTRLRYHNKEVYTHIRSLPPGAAEGYLEARGAHTILK